MTADRPRDTVPECQDLAGLVEQGVLGGSLDGALSRHEYDQMAFLRWRIQRGEIGGPDDGAGIKLTGAQLLAPARKAALWAGIEERIWGDG
jgi:hypothetical protein